jgi:hypothetical protein
MMLSDSDERLNPIFAESVEKFPSEKQTIFV